MAEKFLIVFLSDLGNECEEFEGTEAEAIQEATAGNRHLNYSRKGVRIYRNEGVLFEAKKD